MIVRVEATAESVAAAAADHVERVVAAGPTVIGLPTGRTPIGLYTRLRTRPLDWSQVTTFNLDEFVGLSPDDPRSFRAFMRRHLLDAVGLAAARTHFLDGTASELDAECRRYDAALAAAGGLDLLVCGVGANGHLAFNEPGTSLRAATHVETLLEETRRDNADVFGGEAAVPAQAVTLGMAALLGARRVLLLATGAGKADVVEAILRGPLTTGLPASWLQVHPAVEVIVDRAAAARLS